MPSSRRGGASLAVNSGFFLTGIVSVLLGPIIPELRANWGVTSAQVGWLFVAQFTASSLGAVFSSFHLRRSLIGGYALAALGLAGLAAGGWALAVPALAVTGFGFGLLIPGSNLYIAHRNPESRGASLSILNLVWGLGAVSCPLLVAGLRGTVPLESTFLLLAGLAALTSVAIWLALPDTAIDAAPVPAGETPPSRGASLGFLLLIASMLFLYVGSENAVGGWLVTLSDELTGEQTVVSLFIGSGFWGAVLAGRALAPWALRRVREPTLYKACLGLAGAGTLLLVLSDSRPALAAGAVATGLGMAPLFPLTVSILAAATAATGSRTTGWVMACGGLGGAALPWLTGRVTGWASAPGHGFLVPLAGLALLTLLFGAQRVFAR